MGKKEISQPQRMLDMQDMHPGLAFFAEPRRPLKVAAANQPSWSARRAADDGVITMTIRVNEEKAVRSRLR